MSTVGYAQPTESASEQPDRYQIGVDVQNGKLSVHAHLNHITPTELCCLPAFGQRVGERLSQPRIVDTQHQVISVSFDDSGCFFVNDSQASVDLTYDLSIDELPQDRFWLASGLSPLNRDGLIAFPGESLFIERNARQTSEHKHTTIITLHIDPHHQVVSTLAMYPAAADAEDTLAFEANDKYELIRSYWTFGKQRILTAASGRMSFILSIADGWTFPVESVERELIAILDAYDKWLGLRTPRHVSIYMFTALHDADYHHGFARRGGLILQMGRYAASNSVARRILLAHELFHLYNGEGMQYDPEDYAATAWIREGMTQYLALKSLVALGLIRQSDIHDWMGQSIARNLSGNTGFSSETAYHRGFFLSYAIEQQWALFHTNLSLEGFWKYLAQSASWSQLQNNAAIQKSLELYSGFDFSGFFKQYIYAQQALPIKDILRLSGLCMESYKYTTGSIGLSYSYRPSDAYLHVERVDPDGTAKQAGLRVGDILVPQNDTSWQDTRDKQIRIIRKDKQLQVRIPALNLIANGIKVGACN